MITNDFLLDLLKFQQDGSLAISAPANWTKPPLLEVPTAVDAVLDDLGRNILRDGDHNKTARWHFFVGSPGNGKSAAIGKLCRYLRSEKACRIVDERGVDLAELEPSAVPYLLEVYEYGQKFPSVHVLQDASVVRNPFSANLDPAMEFIAAVKTAWTKGVSLVICTNRGVLEKAYGDNHLNRDVSSTPWFKVLAEIVTSENKLNGELVSHRKFESGRTAFEEARVSYTYLDTRSLLLESQILDELISKAIDESHWEICSSCPDSKLCPFHANREWLADGPARVKFLTVLQRAEVFSGQALVLREALALISLLLSGCPEDYKDVHPCQWVHSQATQESYFSLAVRRIYMSLFAAANPFGLELDPELHLRQKAGLLDLYKTLPEVHPSRRPMEAVLKGGSPSTDVGLGRLLGSSGVLSKLDAWYEPLPTEFLELWDRDFEVLATTDNPMVSEIERKCLAVWEAMEQALEVTSGASAMESNWALRRWSSNFLMHLGFLCLGWTLWGTELDQFVQLLIALTKTQGKRTKEENRQLRELDKRLGVILSAGDLEESGGVPLSENVNLLGMWVRDHLKPRLDDETVPETLACTIAFDGKERANLGAQAFVWLEHLSRYNLNAICFPPEILSGVRDARQRAAARSQYALEDDDVELDIRNKQTTYKLIRYHGNVELDHEQ